MIEKIPRQIEGIREVKVQVVDDGSSDKTVEVSKAAGADFIVSHPRNMGVGAAFKTAVESASRKWGGHDGEYRCRWTISRERYSEICGSYRENKADMVVASRFGIKSAKNMPWIKSFLNRFAANIIGKFLRHPIDDLTCGFRALQPRNYASAQSGLSFHLYSGNNHRCDFKKS